MAFYFPLPIKEPRLKAFLTALVYATVLALALPFSESALAEVEGNCTMCHKYPGFGRIEKSPDDQKKEIKRVFYINNAIFEASYHGKIRCKSCHTGVNKIPHTGVEKVDCATDCHIRDPSANEFFSHKKIVEDFRQSAHGIEGSRSEHKDDLPVCKDCHSHKPYHSGVSAQVGPKNFLEICLQCHKSRAWAERFYEHMIYRTTKRRPSKEVVKLCSTCHANQKLMTKHGLDVVVGFQDTFHAKAISYGNEEVANCLNCHAPYQFGFSPHKITSRRHESSPVHPDNKIKTCRQSGCHTEAHEEFANGGRIHPSLTKVRFRATAPGQATDDPLSVDTEFHATVIKWIQWFYKILIAVVIGGLALHRIFDLYAVRRDRKSEEADNDQV